MGSSVRLELYSTTLEMETCPESWLSTKGALAHCAAPGVIGLFLSSSFPAHPLPSARSISVRNLKKALKGLLTTPLLLPGHARAADFELPRFSMRS